MEYTVILEKMDSGQWFCQCEQVPEAVTQGATIEEAKENIKDAIEMVLAAKKELTRKQFIGRRILRRKMTRQKILLIIFTLFLTASCTRVRNKVVDWLSTSSNFEEYHVRQLYPSLGQDDDCGVCEEWPLYNMWFRYQGTPAQVESAIIAKECSYTEIKPDSAFISCDRNYILEEQSPHQKIDFFDEWETLPENHLLYYRCCRTPHQHFFVFDTVTGYVYHHMVEFRE